MYHLMVYIYDSLYKWVWISLILVFLFLNVFHIAKISTCVAVQNFDGGACRAMRKGQAEGPDSEG